MITLRSLLPPQAPRAAFGTLVKDEFRLAWRTPSGLSVGSGLPLLLLVIYGLLPAFHQSLQGLGGLTLFDAYFPVLIALVIAALGFGLPGPLATFAPSGALLDR
jgi:ABC-2 type transport system permease protein